MRLNFLSIRIQIIFALAVLLTALILVSYFYIASQEKFSDSHRVVVENDNIALRVANLERDVIDMQRNVYIYKESFSNTAKSKVDILYSTIMNEIQQLYKSESTGEYDSNIKDMQFYLTEYYTNFNVVSDYIKRLDRIRKSVVDGELVGGYVSYNSEKKYENNLVDMAQKEILLYLVSYDKVHIDRVKPILRELDGLSIDKRIFGLKDIDAFIKELNEIANLRRNYTYLVNVVMTGNANEILYNSSLLADVYSKKSIEVTAGVDEYISDQVNVGLVISILGVVVTVLFGIYFFWLITQPIVAIAKVFELLSKGHKVNAIPGLSRNDEIGLLANSAAVFKQKNEQTLNLLDEARLSERVQVLLNDELKEQKSKAEEALKVRTNFLANMSHELRTPLNSIIGFTVRLIKMSEKDGYKHIDVLKTVHRNGQHLLNMINDILDLSKIEENKLELSITNFDLSLVVADAVEQVALLAEEKGLLITVDAKPIEIESDPVRLTQVLLNLLSNSVKYTEKGTIQCVIKLDDSGSNVDIIVEDTGIGIRDDDLERLFTRFEQFASDRNSKIGFGTGLGLAIVDNITRLLGGVSTVTSEYGVGSRFIITLPIKFKGDEENFVSTAGLNQSA